MKNLRFHLLVLLVLVSAIRCPQQHDPEAKSCDTIFQLSVLDALMAGVYDGEMTFGELKTHGDFGLGTLNHLDGEMAAIDGIAYQIRADGSVHVVADSEKTPFSVITFFDADTTISLSGSYNQDQVKRLINQWLISPNIPAAIKISGHFSMAHTRSVPAQIRPYRLLTEILKTQPEFKLENVSGTIVGFRLPVYLKNINAPNYYFHFITEDKSAGGHLLSFSGRNMKIEIDYKNHLEIQLPRDQDFRNVDFAKDAGTYH